MIFSQLISLICILFFLMSSTVFLQANDKQTNQEKILDMDFILDYQSVDLTAVNSVDLGFAGIHLLLNPMNSSFYVGSALYAAVRGNYGGFFALGLESGYRRSLIKDLGIDIGVGAAAGGGHGISALIADGNMLQFHAGLNYQLQTLKFGIAYSRVHFMNTDITSNHALFSIHVPFQFSLYSFGYNQLRPYVNKYRNYVSLLLSSYYPYTDVKNVSGQPDTKSNQLVGVEVGRKIAAPLHFLINFKGAFSGRKHGYADLFLGLAYKLKVLNQLNALMKMSIGSGGGADIDTGSGFLVYPQLGLEYMFLSQLGAELDTGLLKAPNGSYHTKTINVQLNYYLNEKEGASPFHLAVRLGNQTYFSPKEENEIQNKNIQLMSAKLDNYLTSNIYLTGQGAFAYSGGVAGYFSGLLGLGINQKIKLNSPISLIAEFLAGAAGGGGLDLGQGLIIEPNIGFGYEFNQNLGSYSTLGKTIALQGGFSSTTFEIGLRYQFSTFL